jgi:crotonobetainyl-CoA:carnitine CoA-transferase CaiB-like acyl-CoA transferase
MTQSNALSGVKVVDAGVLFAGPVIATLLSDFGADVIKVEHPKGDALRTLGWEKNGVSLWWAFVNRNKRCVSIDLGKTEGGKLLLELLKDADVFIESFRPGTLERWGLGPDVLHKANPRLVIVRTTGYGQTGPLSSRPGFGTIAEAMSGFAWVNGQPDGPPLLPPFAMGDGVAAMFGTFATMFALYHRDVHHAPGQVIDLAIYEPLFWILGPQALVYDQLGIIPGRNGSSTEWTAPRNVYLTRDQKWLALSASSQSIAERVMVVVGHPEMVEKPWFADHSGRVAHQAELDQVIGAWIADRDATDVIAAFQEGQAAIGPVYSIADIFKDAQYRARDMLIKVTDPRLGPVTIQNVVPRLSLTPGKVRHLGMDLGAHTAEIFKGLGHSSEELRALQESGVIAGLKDGPA